MRIGFDTSVLVRPHPHGVVRATRGLLEALERRGTLEVVRLAPAPGQRISVWRQRSLPFTPDVAGIHSPVSAFPVLGRGLRIATVHEIPWAAGVGENADRRHRLWARIGPLRADAVITPSRRTARLVREESPLARDRVHVVPWGVDPRFRPKTEADDERMLARHGLAGAPFVLLAGATRRKKNAWIAIEALRALAADVRVVITGAIGDEVLAELASRVDVAARVRLAGEVDDATLAAFTRSAVAAALLSDSEGFGFPVVEAQAAGTPVIVPRETAQAEIAGPHALVVEPRDALAFARAVERARAERNELSARGFENAAWYTWDRAAEQVERIWMGLS